MVDLGFDRSMDRARLGWWVFVLALAAAAVFVVHAFVGIAVLGVFGYYATRPIYERVKGPFGSDGAAAAATLLVVTLPVVVLILYTGFEAFQHVQRWFGAATGLPLFGDFFGALSADGGRQLRSILRSPRQFVTDPGGSLRAVLGAVQRAAAALFNALLVLVLALALAFFLLKNDDGLAAGLRELFGGRDTTAYAYAAAVDDDLESVFFGNFVFVVVMAVIAAVAYGATNLLAPAGLRIPIPFTLAALTGVASLIPVVVGKVVYLPVVAYLGVQAFRTSGSQFVFVGCALAAYVLVLDLLPQGFIQPYVTGQQVNMTMMMFAYILGPMLFGWYGFFFLPILFVALLEVIRIVLPELVHGRPLTPTASMGGSIGADLPPSGGAATEESKASDDSATDDE